MLRLRCACCMRFLVIIAVAEKGTQVGNWEKKTKGKDLLFIVM
jgi:hypothetical protein